MKTLQETAINHARSTLVNALGYTTDLVTPEKMYVVWFCKTLQNWKAFVSGTDIEEYIKVTYNGDKDEAYVDIYNKTKNVVIKGE